jgi:hypothetical protein
MSGQDKESGNSLFVQSLRGDPFRVSLFEIWCIITFLLNTNKK